VERTFCTECPAARKSVWQPRRVPIGEWDHNRWYHGRLLRHVPDGAQRVLEVGCGAGTLARRLAATVPHVDAIDRSPEMLAAAAQGAPANLHLRLDNVLTADLPAEAYDAVLSLSVLHHLPLREALKRMAGALKPGAC
jgi:2-polyprenyl-3-methyl-5-hydroxy-6-metoxy-1,4-benzoquinol methylase